MFMLSEHRLKAVMLEPPCTSFSPANHHVLRSYSKVLLGNRLAFMSFAIFICAVRWGAAALIEQPRLSKMRFMKVWRWIAVLAGVS